MFGAYDDEVWECHYVLPRRPSIQKENPSSQLGVASPNAELLLAVSQKKKTRVGVKSSFSGVL